MVRLPAVRKASRCDRRWMTALLATTLLVGCTANTSESTQPNTSVAAIPQPSADPAIDYHDSDRVCASFVSTIYTRDTTTDTGPGDAWKRAGAYMTTELYAVAMAHGTSDSRWTTWTEHRVRTHVALTPYAGDAHGGDESSLARRTWLATVTPIGADGWQGPVERVALYCRLTPDSDGWRVAAYDLEPLPGGEG